MKKFIGIIALVVLTLGLCQQGMATLLINGTIDTTSSSAFTDPTDNGGSAYNYLINQTSGFNLGPGTAPQTIYGTVTNLSFGSTSSWLEIGFVGKPVADLALLPTYGNEWPPLMFNQSAFFLVSRDSAGNIKLAPSDYNSNEGTAINLGKVTQFDYAFQITPNESGAGGNITVTVGASNSTLPYGVDNWGAAFGYTSDYEFVYDTWPWLGYGVSPSSEGYVIAQGYTQDLSTSPDGFVKADVTAAPVPLPGALPLLGSGLLGIMGWRRFRKI